MENKRCKYDGTLFNQWGVCETCGNTVQKQESVVDTWKKFCPKCGTHLGLDGTCPSCGFNPQKPYPDPYPDIGNSRNTQRVETIFSHAWDYVKVFFSRKPMAAIENAGKDKEHTWAILGAALCVFLTLALFSIGAQEINYGIIQTDGTNMAVIILSAIVLLIAPDFFYSSSSSFDTDKFSNLGELVDNDAKLFFYTLGIVTVLYFAISAMRYLFLMILRKNTSFITIMNVATISYMPIVVASIVAAIAAFINPFIAILVLTVGVIASYIQMYFGLQKNNRFTSSPFWCFIALIAADFIAVYLVSLIFYGIFC